MFTVPGQFSGGGAGIGNVMGTSGSEASPMNNTVEKSGSAGSIFSAPVRSTPKRSSKPTIVSTGSGSRMGRGQMPAADVKP